VATYLLVDGNSLVYRAFFALPTDMATTSGQVTNAVFGFTSMLVNLLKDHRPDGVVVAFDRPEPTFRHDVVEGYKAGRAEAPDVLRQQLGLVRRVVEALQLPVVEAPGYEADDLLATLATRIRDRGEDAIVVTGDRDSFQLVEDPHVKVLYNRRGVSDYALYDEAGILERTGVTPSSYPVFAALRGDASDNIPGVPGVGDKTAARLVNDFGDLDGIFSHLDETTPKLRQSLASHEVEVRRNASAIPLVRSAPVDVDIDSLHVGGWDADEVRDLFAFLEFNSLWQRLVEALGADGRGGEASSASGPHREQLRVELERPRGVDAASALRQLVGVSSVALAASWEGEEGRSPVAGVAIAGPERSGVAVWIDAESLEDGATRELLAGLLGPWGPPLVGHRVKELMRGLDLEVGHLDLDTAVAAYLLDPAEGQRDLEELASRHAGIDLHGDDATQAGQLDLGAGAGGDPAEEAGRQAVCLVRLGPLLRQELAAHQLESLYDDVERPLVGVLARMEHVGVGVDSAYLKELLSSLTEEANRLDDEIQDMAGEPFRVNSTPQLRHVLYEKLALTPSKRTKTGYSTDAASLERLRGQHPIIEALLRYREIEKLRSTYGEGLLSEVGPDGRIHATFNQTVARTGRLSSDRPNLHNIPVRSDEGRRFRRAFVPAGGCVLLVAAYNPIELRVIAHLAEDPGLIEAFSAGEDIHTATASRIFGVEPGNVTLAQRSKAKMVSYGLAYGMEAYGLSQRLNIPVEEAREVLDSYFEAFPSVHAYMEQTVSEARRRGYTETLFGRRRHIPELLSSNFRVRQAGERQAMNAGIQGLAADIFKVALVRLDSRLGAEGLGSRLVLQVHDEVILEVPDDERERAASTVRDTMVGACELSVPLEVDVSWGATWADAKS
jgi:DNA polymerase I